MLKWKKEATGKANKVRPMHDPKPRPPVTSWICQLLQHHFQRATSCVRLELEAFSVYGHSRSLELPMNSPELTLVSSARWPSFALWLWPLLSTFSSLTPKRHYSWAGSRQINAVSIPRLSWPLRSFQTEGAHKVSYTEPLSCDSCDRGNCIFLILSAEWSKDPNRLVVCSPIDHHFFPCPERVLFLLVMGLLSQDVW